MKPDAWRNPGSGLSPAARLLCFQRWVNQRLEGQFRLQPGSRAIHQYKAVVLAAVRELNERGFLLDGDALAQELDATFAAISKQYRTGKIHDLYAYFGRTFDGFVGARAEELKSESLRLGCHVARYTAKIKACETIPALEAQRHAESLRDRLAKERRKTAKQTAAKAQMELF